MLRSRSVIVTCHGRVQNPMIAGVGRCWPEAGGECREICAGKDHPLAAHRIKDYVSSAVRFADERLLHRRSAPPRKEGTERFHGNVPVQFGADDERIEQMVGEC